MFNGTMMQYFEWFLLPKCKLWNEALNEAENLRELGITALWLPPAYKGIGGIYDVGYGAYDLYDLGEFNQKGTVETKYGSKDEYLQAIKKLKENNIQCYADIVVNHKMGGDDVEEVEASEEEFFNRNIPLVEQKLLKLGQGLISREEIISIRLLNGIGVILMELIMMIKQKEIVYISF